MLKGDNDMLVHNTGIQENNIFNAWFLTQADSTPGIFFVISYLL